MVTATNFNFRTRYTFSLAPAAAAAIGPGGAVSTQISGVKGYAESHTVGAQSDALQANLIFEIVTPGSPLWNLSAVTVTDFNGTTSSGSWVHYEESTSNVSPPMYGITIGPEPHILQLEVIRGYFSVALDGLWFDVPLTGSRSSLTPSSTLKYATPMQPYSKLFDVSTLLLPGVAGMPRGPQGPAVVDVGNTTADYLHSFSCTGGDFWTSFIWSIEEE